jgi:hypothetical protein
MSARKPHATGLGERKRGFYLSGVIFQIVEKNDLCYIGAVRTGIRNIADVFINGRHFHPYGWHIYT